MTSEELVRSTWKWQVETGDWGGLHPDGTRVFWLRLPVIWNNGSRWIFTRYPKEAWDKAAEFAQRMK